MLDKDFATEFAGLLADKIALKMAEAIVEPLSDKIAAKMNGRLMQIFGNYLIDPVYLLTKASKQEASELMRAAISTAMLFPATQGREYKKFCVQQASPDGLFCEFGVAQGRSINLFAATRPEITFHGFDSFEGLPENWLGTRLIKKTFDNKGQLPDCHSNVILHKGYFDETLPKFLSANINSKISFVHIDSDLYSSAKTILTHIAPFLQPGSIIMFDELWAYPGYKNHEYKAFMEFCSETSCSFHYIAFFATCATVIIESLSNYSSERIKQNTILLRNQQAMRVIIDEQQKSNLEVVKDIEHLAAENAELQTQIQKTAEMGARLKVEKGFLQVVEQSLAAAEEERLKPRFTALHKQLDGIDGKLETLLVARKFPTAAQKMIINLYAPFVRIGTLLSGQPEFFAKLRIDPSDFFAASRNPFNKIVCGVLAVLGPAPAKTNFSMKRFCHTAGGSNSHADKG